MQLSGVNASLPGQEPDTVDGQRRQPHPPGGTLGGQITQHHPQRMILA